MKPLRLAVVTSHPIQYQAPLFRALAAQPEVELKVFFCWDFGITPQLDPGFGRVIHWDIPLLDGYESELVRNLSLRPGSDHFWGIVNPAIVPALRRFQPDVIVIHGYAHATPVLIAATAKLLGTPVLLRSESSLVRRRSWWVRAAKRFVLRPFLSGLAGGLAIGTRSAEYLAAYGTKKVFIAPYSVDNAFFRDLANRDEARAWRERLGISPGDRVVIFVGKLIPEKSPLTLLNAFLARPRPGAHLVFVGDGPLKSQLEHPAVHCVGFVNQSKMPTAYLLGDVLVLPSQSESWGLAVNEAMALGLPVVVSDAVGCAPDLVSAETGWTFPVGDVAALDAILTEALSVSLEDRSHAARAKIANWDIDATARVFIEAAVAVRK